MSTSMAGPGSLNASTAQYSLEMARESQTLQQVNSAQAGNDDARIEKGAQQFEAMLLTTWLQQAEQSFAVVPGSEDDDQDTAGRDQILGLGVQSLAESMAASGGIGIAKMIAKAMHAEAEKAESAPQTGALLPSEGQIRGGNLSFRLNSGAGSADRDAGSETRSK